MFVSAYLEAARVLGRDDCRAFALKTLDRMLAEAWDESKGFLHRVGGPRLEGSLDDQVFAAAALLDAYEATLDRRYFDIAERAVRLAVERYGDPEGGGFFDRAKDAAPDGRPRRAPQAAAGFADARRQIPWRRLCSTGCTRSPARKLYRDWAEKTLEAFVGLGPAIWIVRRDLWVGGAAARAPSAASGDHWARRAIRKALSWKKRRTKFIASAKPCCASRRKIWLQPRSLRRCAKRCRISMQRMPQALVCVETTCYPPVD